MARPKGTADADVTRRLDRLQELLWQARRNGVDMQLRAACELIAQADAGDGDVLRRIAMGRQRVSVEAWDAIEKRVERELVQLAERRAEGKIQRTRVGESATAQKRAERERRKARRAAVTAEIAPRYETAWVRQSEHSVARALEQAFRDRGLEMPPLVDPYAHEGLYRAPFFPGF